MSIGLAQEQPFVRYQLSKNCSFCFITKQTVSIVYICTILFRNLILDAVFSTRDVAF